MFELVLVLLSLLVIHYKFGARRGSMVDLLSSIHGIYTKWEPWNKAEDVSTDVKSMVSKAPPSRKISAPEFGRAISVDNGRRIGGHEVPKRKISLGNMRSNRNTLIMQGKDAKGAFSPLGEFKSMPTLHPEFANSKSGKKFCCTKCSPVLRKTFAEVQSLGLKNILLVSTMNKDRGFFVNAFCHLIHVVKTNASFLYPDAAESVPSNERVKNAMENAAVADMEDLQIEDAKYSKLLSMHKKRAVLVLENMKSKISTILLRITAYVLFKVFGRILSSIQVPKSQLEMIKKLNTAPVPVIYLPLHRSHLDYILITFILFNYEVKAPLIAAGDNLRIPVFGPLMRGLGAFFIKRKLDPKKGKRDFVYRSILHTYMEQSLNKGHSMEFFIEGGRSRSGKACIPKAGLLSVVVDAFLDGSIEDIYFVPVGISYEKVLDGSFIAEQMGKPKKMESFFSAIRGIWKTFSRSYGSVRVDFGQPFSMQEFVQGVTTYSPNKPRSFLGEPTSPHDTLRRISSSASLYGTDVVIEDQRQLVKELAEHALYDAVHSTALMSTNLVSFLLLNKYRKGVMLRALIQDFNWLWDELKVRGREVGFSGNTRDIVWHALDLLGDKLVHVETPSQGRLMNNDECDLAFVTANLELPQVLEVSYYSNVALSAFLGDAIVATSLFVLLGQELEVSQDCDSQLSVSKQQLVEKALDLCLLLQFEFILTPPCITLEAYLTEIVQEFVTAEILLSESEGIVVNEEEKYSNRVARHFEWDNESDEEELDEYFFEDLRVKVNLKSENIQRLRLYRNILAPFLEGYWHVGCSLVHLVQNEMEENKFVQLVQRLVQEKNSQGLVECSECVAAETLKNAIKLFEMYKVIDSYQQDNVKIIFLTDNFDNEEHISEVLHILEEFKK